MVKKRAQVFLACLLQLCLLTSTFYLGTQHTRTDSFQLPAGSCLEKSVGGEGSLSLLALAHKYKPTKFFPYLHTGYHRFYEKLFEPLRHKKIKFLEIGLDNGNGSLLWEEYFTKAEFHGIEYSSNKVNDASKKVNKINIHYGSQEDVNFLRRFKQQSGGNFDIIIDDGGHHFEHQVNSYKYLFLDNLKAGGIYIIEDIETSYWNGKMMYGREHNGGVNVSETTIMKFKQMVDGVNRKFHDNKFFVFGRVDHWVRSVSFYQNMIVLEKKDERDRPYDSHYIWDHSLKEPASKQGNEWSFGPSPFRGPDKDDPLWSRYRPVGSDYQRKYGPKKVKQFIW